MTEPDLFETAASLDPRAATAFSTTGMTALTVLERPFAILDGPPPSQGFWGWPDLVLQSGMGLLTMPGDLIDAAAASVSSALVPPGLGLPAARVMLSGHLGLPHAHAPPPAPPFLGMGPTALMGAVNVLAGSQPMLRTGDVGFALTCPAPVFKILTGSASVFVAGKRAARLLDVTEHCPFVPSPPAATRIAAQSFTSVVDAMTLASIATGALAHGAAAAHALGDDELPSDVAMIQAGGEVQQIVSNAIQSVGDCGLSVLHEMIGKPPPIGGSGAGVTIPIGMPALVMVGGLPCPELGTYTNECVAQWRRNLWALAHRTSRRRRGGCSWRGAIFGEPVDAVTGHVFADHLDVDLGGGLAFGRHYDSRTGERVGDVGRGMRHSYERELDVWLHRCRYVDEQGVRVDFPAFRGRDRVSLDGYVLTRCEGGRYEVAHAGETMVFVARPGVRAARLLEIRSAEWTRTIEQDAEGRFRAVRVAERALFAHRDADGRVVLVRDERGVERASYAYERGCLVASRDAEGHEQRSEYDAAHRLVSWRGARGYRFTWRYDEAGRCVHTSGEDRQWWSDFAYEKLKTTVTHASGLVETLHYDAYGTVLRVTRSDGTSLLREQDETGRIVRERDGAGRVVELAYDAAGALVGRRDRFGHPISSERGASSPRARRLPVTHAGRLGLDALDDAPGPASASAIPEALEALAAWALPPVERSRAPRVERDALGRPIRLVDARGRGITLRRDAAGNVVERTDRDRRTTRRHVGGWNRVEAEVDALGRRVESTYTTTEEVRTYRDPLGVLTEYGRDAADRLTSITRAGALRETYVHDAAGRLVEKKDARGEPLLRVAHHANALPGRISLARGGTIELDYDARGRVTRARLGEHDARIERDETGTILFDHCAEGGVRRWSFDAREICSLFERFETCIAREGERIVVRDPTGGLTSFDARVRGRVTRQLANGTREILAFDPEGHLEGRLAHRRTSDGALASWAVRYERSGEGDLLGVWDSARGERRFVVDAAHRLAGERDERGVEHAYVLDADDHLLAKPGLARAEHDAAGLLLRTERERFEHDARGRMSLRRDVEGREVRYGYDSLDQLVEVDLGDGGPVWRGSYDGLGRLRRFGREGAETSLAWDGDRVAAEVSPSGALRVHVYAHARALIPFAFVDYASVDAEPAQGRAYYVFHDASGMPTQIEDASGRTVWWADRVDPYGAITLHEGAEVDYALRWPGHYFDRDLGLHHNRFRAYDPALARYLQPDPIGHAGSPHGLYAYAPNPLVHVDLLGLHADEHPRPAHASEEEGEGHPLQEEPPGSYRDRRGHLHGADGRFIEDPNAAGPGRPDLRCTREEITGGRVASIAADPRAQAHLDARRRALERARVATTEETRQSALAEARGHSEQLGVMATEAEIQRRFPGAEREHSGAGPDTFDSVWRIPGRPPRYVVAESKGGSARESSSRLLRSGDRAQQGTPEYRADVQRAMAESGDPEAARVGRDLARAGDARVTYLAVSQPISRDGRSLSSIRVYSYGASRRVSGNAPPPRPRRSS